MITINDLSFSYGRESLFEGLDLSLESGGIYGLLGRNGAGKTSLLRIISGQLYRHGGACAVLGFDPSRRIPELLSEIYFLPEEFHIPSIRADAYLRAYAPFYPKFDEGRFSELVEEFELNIEKRLSAFSYGQKKKFLLAFALASGSRILLLDEPTNGLDIPSKRQFRRAVAASLTDEQVFLISTHQVRDMENLIDPIIVLDQGRIVFSRQIDDVAGRLSVSVEPAAPTGPDVVYTEKSLGGYTVLRVRPSNNASIDLELLFNAIVDPDSRLTSAILDEEAAK